MSAKVDALRGEGDRPSRTARSKQAPGFVRLVGRKDGKFPSMGDWGVEYDGSDGHESAAIHDDKGRVALILVALLKQGWRSTVDLEARCDYIVTAVNSHASLVEALKVCSDALAFLTEPEVIRSTTVINAWAQVVAAKSGARAALLKATGSKASECGEQT